MIRALHVEPGRMGTDSLTPWWPKVPGLASLETLTFEPGLNILWGPNGSGKSTVLRLLAKTLLCEQGGFPALTQEAVSASFRLEFRLVGNRDESPQERQRRLYINDAVRVEHDGRVAFFDGRAVGLLGGMSALDDDFMEAGIIEATRLNKASAGQGQMYRLGQVVERLFRGVGGIDDRLGTVNSLWEERAAIVRAGAEPNIDPGGPATLLLDEPTRSLDLPTQVGLWKRLPVWASRKIQIIVAAHDPMCLDLDAHWIELTPGYLEQCRRIWTAIRAGGVQGPDLPSGL